MTDATETTDELLAMLMEHQRCEIRFDIAGAYFLDCDMRLDGSEYTSITQARHTHIARTIAGWVRQQQAAAREAIAAQIHSIGGTALGVYTDDYQDGLTHATLTVLTGNTKHPNRYTPEERAQMFGLLNDLNRRAYSAATEPKDAGA
jgi:hypothetical protein